MTLCEAWENFKKGVGVATTGETYGKSWEVVKENFPKGFKEFGTAGLLGVDPDTFDRYINGQMSEEEFNRTSEIIAFNLALMGRGKALGLGEREAIKAELTAVKAWAKAVNLPSWKKVTIDMEHVLSGHMKGGSRVGSGSTKDLFPENMTAEQIEREIREAYRYGKRIKTQGDTVRIRGNGGTLDIEMWVNTVTKEIETAYPIF